MESKRYSKDKKQKKSAVNEPESVYEGKHLLFFDSLEEENEYTYRMRADITPTINIRNVVEFMKRFYSQQLKCKSCNNKRLHFD